MGIDHSSRTDPPQTAELPPKTAEKLLLDLWPVVAGSHVPARVLCTSPGRAQLARFLARNFPQAEVAVSFLDLHMLRLAEAAADQPSANLALRCEPELSGSGADVVALPLSAQGDGEWTRDVVQQGYLALRDDGLLLAATDNPRDRWLGEVLQALGGALRRFADPAGVVYAVRRSGPPPRVRDYSCEFKFRDGERLFDVVTRPGVFSHRRIDPGARRLIDALDLQSGERVLDIGCGWGAVGLAAVARHDDVIVEALDSNARAVECAVANAVRNGFASRFSARLEAEGRTTSPGLFDVALGNPPYYADFRIAELFTAVAFAALRPGGRLTMVTKFAEWYLDNWPGRFDDVAAREVKGYVLVTGRKRRT